MFRSLITGRKPHRLYNVKLPDLLKSECFWLIYQDVRSKDYFFILFLRMQHRYALVLIAAAGRSTRYSPTMMHSSPLLYFALLAFTWQLSDWSCLLCLSAKLVTWVFSFLCLNFASSRIGNTIWSWSGVIRSCHLLSGQVACGEFS